MPPDPNAHAARVFGHPPSLFVLFFAEMWERFSYYGMRALLVLYMLKGFLGYDDDRAYAVYGTYTALVYATPLVGGMLADRVIGARLAVILGGVLMALGHLLMTIETPGTFFAALGLLIVGNGFFKPNVSNMVGELYGGDARHKDAGFTLFYMGINLGAAVAPLLCGYVAQRYGWHYGFGLATVGMLTGLGVFVTRGGACRALVLISALGTAGAMLWATEGWLKLLANGLVAFALCAAAVVGFVAVGKGDLPPSVGAPPNGGRGGARGWLPVVLGAGLAVAVMAALVRHEELSSWVLRGAGLAALALMLYELRRASRPERRRLSVVLVMMLFSMVFWSFFEQAGTSLNNFADRNVDRVNEQRTVTAADVGSTLHLTLNQEQLGYPFGGAPFTIDRLDAARSAGVDAVDWPMTVAHVGMGIGGAEVATAEFQAANPVFILIFGLLFTALWSALGARGIEPGTPAKFALGIAQLGLGFGALWLGAQCADGRGMVGVEWLLLGYLLMTTGELCVSPVGLSMVTKLAPRRIVGTVMGAWFMAMAFSNYLASLIARLTGVPHDASGLAGVPVPSETLAVYAGVFGHIALAALAAAGVLAALVPLLARWLDD